MMQRLVQSERPDWRQRCESLGFGFHSIGGIYWKESVAYRYTLAQIERLEEAALELHAMALDWVDDFVRRGDWHDMPLPLQAIPVIERSWRDREPGLMGRFDLSWDGVGPMRLLEYNADTPTSLIESSLVQWDWKEVVQPEADQFNRLHEALVERWHHLRPDQGPARLLIAGHYEQAEDASHLDYLLDTALQGGWSVRWMHLQDLGWDGCGFVDDRGQAVDWLFKLYPWEWIWRDPFGIHVAQASTRWIEPAWKVLCSSKAMLVHLWRRHPGHPLLLPAGYHPAELPAGQPFVRKPIWSREGAGTRLCDARGHATDEVPIQEPEGGWVYQVQAPLPRFGDYWTVTGAWMVGDEACGMCLREDVSPITQDSSHFVPHYLE